MKFKPLLLMLSLVLLSCACEDTLKLEDDLRISEEEIEVFEDCQKSKIITIKQIEENLIGSWKLVGYACGNCIDGETPSASINFQVGGGRYQYDDGFEQIDAGFTWNIEEGTDIFGEPVLELSTNPIFTGLFAEVFCQNYMAFNQTPVDGPLLIYAKR